MELIMNLGPVRDGEGSGIALLWRKEPGRAVVRSSGFYRLRGNEGLDIT
jgi:hypothetical protein